MVTACGGGQDFGEEEEEEEEEELGSSSDAIQNTNALNPNALNPNALNPNALNPNALDLNGLNLNALNPNSLSADDLNAIQDPGTRGTISRELLKYTVGCAMDTSQAFEFTWTDTLQVAHPERYTGLLGLAPEWYDNPLSNAKGRWISACLASRVNWYGAAVMISSRGSHQQLKHVDAVEHSTYPAFEGAFFGDAFASSPVYYACYDPTNVTHSRSLLRECASGHPNGTGGILECGPIHVLGPCENYCTSWNATEGFYEQCRASSGSPWYGEVVSTFLP
jgi:hypothetical protein